MVTGGCGSTQPSSKGSLAEPLTTRATTGDAAGARTGWAGRRIGTAAMVWHNRHLAQRCPARHSTTGTLSSYPIDPATTSGLGTILWAGVWHTVPRMPSSLSSGTSLSVPHRISFGRIDDHLDVPNLLAIQTDAFEWLAGRGLAEMLDEVSPIEDFSGTMSLALSEPRFEEVKASIRECKEKDLTY